MLVLILRLFFLQTSFHSLIDDPLTAAELRGMRKLEQEMGLQQIMEKTVARKTGNPSSHPSPFTPLTPSDCLYYIIGNYFFCKKYIL